MLGRLSNGQSQSRAIENDLPHLCTRASVTLERIFALLFFCFFSCVGLPVFFVWSNRLIESFQSPRHTVPTSHSPFSGASAGCLLPLLDFSNWVSDAVITWPARVYPLFFPTSSRRLFARDLLPLRFRFSQFDSITLSLGSAYFAKSKHRLFCQTFFLYYFLISFCFAFCAQKGDKHTFN